MRKRLVVDMGTPVNKSALEELMERGVMDDRDVDYLNHLEVETPDEVAMEGVVKAVLGEAVGDLHNAGAEMKGWFLGIESKRKYIEEICQNLIDWLKDKKVNYRDLDLDMGTFKTWMKTSETYRWRYYFLLDDATWREIEADLKNDRITHLEGLYDVSFKDRQGVARYLDSISNIDGLIKTVEKYKERSNKFFELIIKRQVKIKMAPFQVILLGATDLRITVKKIVNLAT
jgi:hypothetical protein